MTLLKELIEAAEQAARDQVIAAINAPFFPGEFRIVQSTRGALERVVKAAAVKAADDAQADAVRRLGQSNEMLAQQAEEYRSQAILERYEKSKLQAKLKEAKEIIKALQDGASHTGPDFGRGRDCAHCQAYGRATKFLEAA